MDSHSRGGLGRPRSARIAPLPLVFLHRTPTLSFLHLTHHGRQVPRRRGMEVRGGAEARCGTHAHFSDTVQTKTRCPPHYDHVTGPKEECHRCGRCLANAAAYQPMRNENRCLLEKMLRGIKQRAAEQPGASQTHRRGIRLDSRRTKIRWERRRSTPHRLCARP